MLWDIIFRALGGASLIGLAIAAAVFIAKSVVERGIQHQFNGALEELKSELRLQEEKLKATITAEQDHMRALQQLVLSGMSNRNQALDKRRLEAIERLWKGIVELQPLRSVAWSTQNVRLDRMVDEATKGDLSGTKMKEFAGLLLQMAGADKHVHDSSLDLERLYVPAVLWAKFFAYQQVLYAPFARLMLAKNGFDAKFLGDEKEILDLLKALLPHATSYVDTWGIGAISPLVDQLTTALVVAFQDALTNPEGDPQSLKTAATLMETVRATVVARSAAPPLPAVPDKAVLASAPPPPPL